MIKLKTALSALVFTTLLGILGTTNSAAQENQGNSTSQGKMNATLHTNMGNILLQLDADRAPITVANFIQYANTDFYNGTIFHRVIPRFMIQGGGFTPKLKQKKTANPIKNESKNRWHNERGTIAMARTNDPDSATAQFFINVRMNSNLDYRYGRPGYTVFGKVISGLDIVDGIAMSPTQATGPHQNVPLTPIIINSVSIGN